METIRILECFAGIGACSKAFERLNIPHVIVDAVEIDKYAVKSFNAIHGTNFKPQDIREWDKDIEVDLIMHGSPCQDFSLAGKQAGGDEGSGTRSSLMYETLRIIGKLKPKYVIWENVKNLVSEKHIHNFNNYLSRMRELGYKSYWKVLNAKDYTIPQNRERVFTISIREDLHQIFEFPEPVELKLRLKDLLEDEVDEKYYLSEKMLDYCIRASNENQNAGNGFEFEPVDLTENGGVYPRPSPLTKGQDSTTIFSTTGGDFGDDAQAKLHNTMAGAMTERAEINPDVAYPLAVKSAGGQQRAGISNFVTGKNDPVIPIRTGYFCPVTRFFTLAPPFVCDTSSLRSGLP